MAEETTTCKKIYIEWRRPSGRDNLFFLFTVAWKSKIENVTRRRSNGWADSCLSRCTWSELARPFSQSWLIFVQLVKLLLLGWVSSAFSPLPPIPDSPSPSFLSQVHAFQTVEVKVSVSEKSFDCSECFTVRSEGYFSFSLNSFMHIR
jgi:hypothetical protein